MKFKLIIACILILLILTVSSFAQTLNTEFPDGSRQILTSRVVGKPDYMRWTSADNLYLYQEEYPLVMREFGQSDLVRPNREMQFDWAGITACHQLIYNDNSGDMTGYFNNIARAGSALKWSIQINCDNETKAIARVTEYINSAIGKTQAQTVVDNGLIKYVISTYWHVSLSAASWANLRNGVRNNTGKELYIIGDYGPWCSWGSPNPRSTWNDYKTTADAWYVFADPVYETTFNDIANAMTAINKPYAGGIVGGAGRETARNAYYVDANGTQFFRDWWQKSLDKSIKWQTVNTWNDTDEKHHIFPSSDWNWTRADLNAFYSYKLRNINPSRRFGNVGTLYVTTPRQLHLNEASVAEALVINSSDRTIIAKVQLLDNQGSLIGTPTQVNVAPKSTGSAQIAINYGSQPAGSFIRARAWMIDGSTTKTVDSAPICIYPSGYSTDLRLFYYSIPEGRASGTKPTLALNATTATVTNVVAYPRFVEVLQNSREVKNMFNHTPFTCSYPLDPNAILGGRSEDWDLPNSSYKKAGFYVARVIDESEKVSYSDPVWVEDVTDAKVIDNNAKDLLIFPNPSSEGVINIEVKGFDFDTNCLINISIFDIGDKLVFKKQQNSAENFSLVTNLKKGIYLVKAEYAGNLFCKKLIIN